MTLKERVRFLRKENEILSGKIEEIFEALQDIQHNTDTKIANLRWSFENQYKVIRNEKSELEINYTKAIYALKLIMNMNPHKFRGTEVHHLLVELGVVPR